jgi:hypothetical protein
MKGNRESGIGNSRPLGMLISLREASRGWLFPISYSLWSRQAPNAIDQRTERADHRVVPFAEQRGKDVLTDPVSPQVIAAVTSRDRRGVEVHPMVVVTAYDVVTAVADPRSFELEAAFQPIQVNPAGSLEIDCWMCHSTLLLM